MNERITRPGRHTVDRKGTNWPALMEHVVQDGVEMTAEEVGKVASVTRQCIYLIERQALRKLSRNAMALRLVR